MKIHMPIALSGEHTGFTFERDLAKAEDMIRLHSGGENALALRACLLYTSPSPRD